MKKLFTIAILGLLSTGAFAQTSKGTIVLSGEVAFGRSENEDEYSDDLRKDNSLQTNFSFTPSVGYFIQDNLKLGISLGYNYQNTIHKTSAYSNQAHTRYNGYSVGTHLIKYFMVTEKLAITVAGSSGFYQNKGVTKYKSDLMLDSKNEEVGFRIGFTPGITFFPSDKLGISTSFGFLGYDRSNSESVNYNETIKSTDSRLGLDLRSYALNLNLNYYINR
jgi:hypothetical protein